MSTIVDFSQPLSLLSVTFSTVELIHYHYFYSIVTFWFSLQLKESNIEEVVKQSSEAEESAKVFLEELLSDVCGSIDKQKSEYMESANKCDAEGKSQKV